MSYLYHRIFVRTRDGHSFEAFVWRRDAAAGVARAMREGKEFGFDVVEAWAEPIVERGKVSTDRIQAGYVPS